MVDVYDSAPYSSSTSKVLLKQVAAVAKCQDNMFEVRFIDVQVQEGTNDCGLFAIAFATALCNGVDPYSLSLDQKSMREHLLNCVEEGDKVSGNLTPAESLRLKLKAGTRSFGADKVESKINVIMVKIIVIMRHVLIIFGCTSTC